MTVIMAVKRNDEVWVGSDTRISSGDFKIDYDIEQDCKLVILNHAVIGAAGDLTMRNLLELFASKGAKETVFESKLDVIAFFLRFKKFLKRHAGLGESEQNQVQNLWNTGWVVATKTAIFEVDQDGAVLEVPESSVIGSGCYSARAVLDYIFTYQPSFSTSKAMLRAHQMAVKHNLSCGGPQVQINVTKLLS
jgi:ATP-dependent protease HslVU (ClpYQ) peptidase subunit